MRKKIADNIGDVVTVQLNGEKDSVNGILVNESESWILLKFIPIDFQIDGFLLVNKKHIQEVQRNPGDEFKKKVISAKDRDILANIPNINVDGELSVFTHFIKSKELVQIESEDNDVAYIGRITKTEADSITLYRMGTKGLWTDKKKIPMTDVWCIFFNNDYVNSLTSYNKTLKKDEI